MHGGILGGLFERFTERARQVVVFGQEEARALKHNYIGSEHLLLGLLREEEGIAARVLESLGITIDAGRATVARIVGSGEKVTAGMIPFTPRAKKVLELALREALSLGDDDIDTEHILLGLVREHEDDTGRTPGVAARILHDFDANPEKIRNQVIRMLPSRPVASQRAELATEEPQPGQLVVSIELSITPPPAGVEQLTEAAIDAVRRVYESEGAEVHWAGVRRIGP